MYRTLASFIIEVWNINLATGLVVIKLNQYHFYSLERFSLDFRKGLVLVLVLVLLRSLVG